MSTKLTKKIQLLGISQILPPATQLTIGGVIVGDGLNITKDGTLSVDVKHVQEELKLDGYVKSDLSILANADLTNRESSLYVYQDGIPKKTTISELVDKKIQTVETVPDDFIKGNYIFKEIK